MFQAVITLCGERWRAEAVWRGINSWPENREFGSYPHCYKQEPSQLFITTFHLSTIIPCKTTCPVKTVVSYRGAASGPTLNEVGRPVTQLPRNYKLLPRRSQRPPVPSIHVIRNTQEQSRKHKKQQPTHTLHHRKLRTKSTRKHRRHLHRLFPVTRDIQPRQNQSRQIPTRHRTSQTTSPPIPKHNSAHDTTRNRKQQATRTTPQHKVQFRTLQSDRNTRPQHSTQPHKLRPHNHKRKQRTTRHTRQQQPDFTSPVHRQLSIPQPIRQPHQVVLHQPAPRQPLKQQVSNTRPTPRMHSGSLHHRAEPTTHLRTPEPHLNQSRTTMRHRTQQPPTHHDKDRTPHHVVLC